MKENYKKWIIVTLALSLVIPGLTAAFNYFMDPLWCFSLSHRYNQKQDDFNERQQKTNYVTFHDFDYDALIIGSSTSTNIDQHKFRGIRVYNYAINALQPLEYPDYIAYARTRNGRDFRYIFIGLDFLLTPVIDPPPFKAEKIFEDTQSPLYRVKTLVSISTLKYSRRNFMNYLYGRHIYYDRNNVKYSTMLTREAAEFNMTRLMQHIEKSNQKYSFNNYKHNVNYHAILEAIRDQNPNTRFVIFTTPVIQAYMTAIVRNNLLGEYENWIRNIVDVFGECYDFMVPTRLTESPLKYFHDPNHYYPFVADMMIDAMYNSKDPEASGICVHVTRANVNEKLAAACSRIREAAARD